jgi:hypothetical protein
MAHVGPQRHKKNVITYASRLIGFILCFSQITVIYGLLITLITISSLKQFELQTILTKCVIFWTLSIISDFKNRCFGEYIWLNLKAGMREEFLCWAFRQGLVSTAGLCCVQTAQLSRHPSLHLKTETDPVYEML